MIIVSPLSNHIGNLASIRRSQIAGQITAVDELQKEFSKNEYLNVDIGSTSNLIYNDHDVKGCRWLSERGHKVLAKEIITISNHILKLE